MADIKLVIKIPTTIYEASQILDVKHEDTIQIPLEVIANGTVLPKGHGDLIDRSKLKTTDVSPEPWYSPMWAYSEWMIDDAEVVIPADKEYAE